MTNQVPKKSSRILTFDLMRGYFLVAIILDHLNFFPSGLDWWSARGDLFVTTAEGFFFISGIVLGIVRGSKLIDKPFRYVATLLLKRSLQLYLTSIVLVFIFTVVGWQFIDNPGLKIGILPPDTHIVELIWQTVTLQYLYGWADYLRLYAIFLLVSPLVMWLLRNGKWYIALAGSFAVWLLFPGEPYIPDVTQELFQPLSWQLLFFGGMIVGFHWKKLTTWWTEQATRKRHVLTGSVLGIAAVTFTGNLLVVFGSSLPEVQAFGITDDLRHNLYIYLFDKERLPITRLIMFLAWFWAAFYLFRKLEPLVVRWLGWLLLPFGTNSLYVYTVHAFLVYFVHLWFTGGSILLNFLVSISIILLIRIMIHYKFLVAFIPR